MAQHVAPDVTFSDSESEGEVEEELHVGNGTFSETESEPDMEAAEPTGSEKEARGIRSGFKTPANWVLALASLLAFSAGISDVVAYFTVKTFVTHVTGTVAKIGMRFEGAQVGTNSYWDLHHTIFVVLSFIAGSFLCGLLIDHTHVHIGSKALYGTALLGESCLLLLTRSLLPHYTAAYWMAMALGLQNAMCTSHLGAVLRTTHVTGTATDIGSTSGRLTMLLVRNGCRKSRMDVIEKAKFQVDASKLGVLLVVFTFFLVGCIAGAYFSRALGTNALLIPAGITGTAGLIYSTLRNNIKRCVKAYEDRQTENEKSAKPSRHMTRMTTMTAMNSFSPWVRFSSPDA